MYRYFLYIFIYDLVYLLLVKFFWLVNCVYRSLKCEDIYICVGIIFFQYERKGTEGGRVFVYVNEVLKPNEMIGVKEEDNIEPVRAEIICKSDKNLN